MGLLSLLSIAGIGLMAARLLDARPAVALFHAVSAIVLILYLGGLAGLLWPTALALHVGGVAMLGVELFRLHRERRRPGLPVPMAVLVVCTVMVYLVHGASELLYYDEFAHWGVFIKEMLALDGFWQADTNSMHPRYPPAAPLWLYFFSAFREYSEGMAFVAQFVLLLTPLLVLWERLSWRQWPWVLLTLAIGLLLIANYGLGVASLYVDPVIGAWFVGIILCFLFEAPGPRRALVYALPLTVLALIKEATFAFTLAAACTLGLLIGLKLWRSSHRVLPALRVGFACVAVFLVCAVSALQAWSLHLDRIGAPEDIEAVGGIVSGLASDGESADASFDPQFTRRFLEVFVGQQLASDSWSRQFNEFSYPLLDLSGERFRLSTLGLFALFAVWWVILPSFVLAGPDRLQWGAAAACVALTGAAFVFAMYLGYRYVLGEAGLVLASYTRYVNTIALPMLVIAIAPLLPAFRASNAVPALHFSGRPVALPSLFALLACVGLYVLETPYLRPVFEPNPAVTMRRQLEPATSGVRATVVNSPVWVYLPDDLPNQFVGRLIQYLLAPTPAHIERDPAFLDRDSAAVFDEWGSFRYLWIATEPDAAAKARFAAVTGLALSGGLFAVDADAAGKLMLTPASQGL